jgi:hypothetical protein
MADLKQGYFSQAAPAPLRNPFLATKAFVSVYVGHQTHKPREFHRGFCRFLVSGAVAGALARIQFSLAGREFLESRGVLVIYFFNFRPAESATDSILIA